MQQLIHYAKRWANKPCPCTVSSLPVFPVFYKGLSQHPMSIKVTSQFYCPFLGIRTTFLPSQSLGAPGKIIKLELSGGPHLG